jgi:hypothetical protein
VPAESAAHSSLVETLRFNHYGQKLASAGSDGTTEILDAPPAPRAPVELPAEVFAR